MPQPKTFNKKTLAALTFFQRRPIFCKYPRVNLRPERRLYPGFDALKDQGRCPFCTKHVVISELDGFLSYKEFKLSGLCQSCQDTMFGEEEE